MWPHHGQHAHDGSAWRLPHAAQNLASGAPSCSSRAPPCPSRAPLCRGGGSGSGADAGDPGFFFALLAARGGRAASSSSRCSEDAAGPKARATSACCRFNVGMSYTLSNVFAVVPAMAPHSAVEVQVSFIKETALRLKLCVPKRSRGNPSKGC